MALLDEAAGRRLILLRAPAGYGKTTLAAEWSRKMRDQGAVVAWLSLDADDNEPSTFAYHLAKAIDAASDSLGREALELLEASSLIPARNVVSALVNAVSESESESFLVLDDFHVLTDSRCHDLTVHLLRYAPSNLHLVIMSRTEPALPLSRLRLADDIVEIDASLLHFDLAETRHFLGADLSKSLDAAGVAKLHSATEGWPAALQLARILLRNSPDPKAHVRKLSGASRSISEYLEDTLATEPDEIVEFLLKTSILDELNGPLCEAVTGMADGGRLLRALERRQFLLVPLDESGVSYRYHHLLREFLLHRLSATRSGEAADLYRRAYGWYASQDLWKEAVHHAIQARDFEQALGFIENCAMSLVIKGDLLTLLAWERQLPPELMGGQYEVKLALAWGMMLVTRFKEADRLLVQVEKAAEDNVGSDLYWRCKAARAILHAMGDDSARGRDLAAECLDAHAFDAFNYNALCNVVRYGHLKAGDWTAFHSISKPDPTGGVSSYVLAEIYRLSLHGIGAAQQLKLDEALGLYDDAKALAEAYTGAKSVSAVMVAGLNARVKYERGDVQGAEVAVLDAWDLIETTVFHEGFLQSITVLVRSAAMRGDVPRAMGFLNRAERLAWERGWGRVVAALLVERTRLLLAEGNVDDALSLLQAFEQLKTNHDTTRPCSRSEIETYSSVAKGLIAGASNYNEDAIALLESAYNDLLAVDDKLGALRVGADLATAYARSPAPERSFALVKDLVASAESANAVSFALERGTDVTELLVAASAEGVFADDSRLSRFVSTLLGRVGEPEATTSEPAAAGTRSRQELTRRERSIVEFIATGQSNKEIARELGVTPETIKTHVKRIFQKLSAETRAQAVVRAQSLGLLGGPGHPINTRLSGGLKTASPPL